MTASARDPERSRLIWRCRRGMKELDLLLLRWIESDYAAAGPERRALFAALLELPDPQLVRYLTGAERPEHEPLAALIEAIAGSTRMGIMSARNPGTPA